MCIQSEPHARTHTPPHTYVQKTSHTHLLSPTYTHCLRVRTNLDEVLSGIWQLFFTLHNTQRSSFVPNLQFLGPISDESRFHSQSSKVSAIDHLPTSTNRMELLSLLCVTSFHNCYNHSMHNIKPQLCIAETSF